MRQKIPVILSGVMCESISEASDRFGIGINTIRKAITRATSDGGSTMVMGKVLKIVGSCDTEVTVHHHNDLESVEITSGRSSVNVPSNRVSELIDKLTV